MDTCFFSGRSGLNSNIKSRTISVETELRTAISDVISAAIKEASSNPLNPLGRRLLSNSTKVCLVASPASFSGNNA